jgi:hypothetical protein
MNPIRAMSPRGRALLWLIGALALALAFGGRASADTCLNSNNWIFDPAPLGSVDGTGTVHLVSGPVVASQGISSVHHPVLSGTVVNLSLSVVYVKLHLFDSSNQLVASVWVGNIQDSDLSFPPTAKEVATWYGGIPSNFTIDADAILAHHFPGINLSTVANVSIELFNYSSEGDRSEFSNLCLTDGSTPYTVTSLYDPNKAVKSGAVIPLKLQLRDAGGTNVSSSSLVVNATGLVQKDKVPDGVLTDAGNANADNNFRYDATLQGYIYNLKTTGLDPGTWCLTFTVNGQSDPSYQLIFNVK